MKNLLQNKREFRSRPINIMYVVDRLGIGGAERIVSTLIKNIDSNFFVPYLCCLKDLGMLGKELRNSKFNTFSLESRPGIDWFLPFRLANLFRQMKIDIIHAHNSTACVYAVISAKLAGVPYIIQTRHGEELFQENFLKKVIKRFILSFLNKIICVSKKLYNCLIQEGWFNPKKVMYIYNGIDVEQFNLNIDVIAKRKEIKIEENDKVILNIGNIRPEKDQANLIEAVSLVKSRIPNSRLLIVGDNDDKNLAKKIRNMTLRLNLVQNVIFLGYRKDIPELLKCSDIFVLSSVTEAMPISILEAMAAKLPIIATDVGDNSIIIKNNETGLLVPPNDPQQLANCIILLFGEPNIAKELGENAYNYVIKNFSSEKMVKEYEKLYFSFCPKYY